MTLLLFKSNDLLLSLQDACKTALQSLYLTLYSPFVLFGGGCWQSILAQYLKHKVRDNLKHNSLQIYLSLVRGAFGKFLAWSFISVTDLQTLSCLVSF